MIKEFKALDKNRALRLALNFWYRNYVGKITLAEFVSRCTWKKIDTDFIVTYYDYIVVKKDKWQ